MEKFKVIKIRRQYWSSSHAKLSCFTLHSFFEILSKEEVKPMRRYMLIRSTSLLGISTG